MGSERFYIDCEFDGHNGPLLSIAIVRGDGESLHIETTDPARDPWVVENVMPVMGRHKAQASLQVSGTMVGRKLAAFIGNDAEPIIIADSPVDIARFCDAISTAPGGGYAPCIAPRLSFEVHDVDCYPTDLPGAVQHNAWWDAMALRHKLARAAQDTQS
jgi:hypothetical protein